MLSAVALLVGQAAIACRCLGNAVALQGCAGRFQEGLNFFFTGGLRWLKRGGNDTKFTFSDRSFCSTIADPRASLSTACIRRQYSSFCPYNLKFLPICPCVLNSDSLAYAYEYCRELDFRPHADRGALKAIAQPIYGLPAAQKSLPAESKVRGYHALDLTVGLRLSSRSLQPPAITKMMSVWSTEQTKNEMPDSYLLTLLHMRLLVGFLGERAQCAWWPTAFYEASSKLFLEPVFSKTSRLAQYQGVLEAARRLHDEHLSVGSYHLFRLTEEVEQDLHVTLQSRVGEELANQAPQSKEAALDALKRLAATGGTSSIGPTAVGNIKDLDSTDTLKAIAAAYLSAFTQNAKTYPYLVG